MSVASQIKSGRETKGWTQERLAKELGYTRAAIAQWENPKTTPKLRREDILALSRLLDKPPSAFTPFGGDTVRTANEDKHAILLLNWEDLAHVALGGEVLTQAIKSPTYLEVDKDISKKALGLVLDDDSMAPKFAEGEEIVIDPDIDPEDDDGDPDYVLVRLTNTGEHLFRRYRQRDHSTDTYDLVPVNPTWDTVTVSPRNPAEIIGTLVQHTVKRRKSRKV